MVGRGFPNLLSGGLDTSVFCLRFYCLHLQVVKVSSSGNWVVGGLRNGS